MRCSSETLQNLPYFRNTKTDVVVFFLFALLFFSPNECPGLCPGLCQHRLGHSLRKKNLVAYKMKNTTWIFVFPKVWQILKHFAGTFHQE